MAASVIPLTHILLVEDSALVVDALRMLFEEFGHRVSVAGTVAETVAVARRERPDVMLLDLGLPDGNGLAALEQLVAEGAAPRVTFALTGDDSAAVLARCAAAGCHELLVKPVSPRVLLSKVSEAMADSIPREQGS